ncbi:endonuclease V [Micromonospora yangpuensis]|uniref:Endonuclease V n=1 Tax=Micromonospora yangpuensis TaxID=683228 RepID=A0A1C6U700_9ACTN|nr:endonuclease V [Micromonospora yangpuensis]SCL49713.1 Endonuclease V [Micromonospora yangpuensis]
MTEVAPVTVAEAERVQEALRRRVDLTIPLPGPPATVAGLDVSYEVGSDRVVAAAVLLDVATARVRRAEFAVGEVNFPYVPGLLAFREVPFLLAALEKLTVRPDVLVCDGYGVAHPRRFGLACHLGVLTGLPSLGVAKTPFTARFDPPEQARGAWSPLVDGGETVGRAVRTQTGVKPVFVSVGHRIGLAEATGLTLALAPRYRIPEPTRQADLLSRTVLRELPPAG